VHSDHNAFASQDVVANATMFSSHLDATGHAAVNGIFFATGKADLQPESEAVRQEVT
jgi:hypothetical protein